MALHNWWVYVTVVFLVSGSPGPNMLHVMMRSVQYGPGRAMFTMAGCLSAIMTCLIASSAGLGAVLTASPHIFDVLKYAGATYLVYLGIKSWRSPVDHDANGDVSVNGLSAWQLYRSGLLTGMSNPKLIVFAAALFPQFINAHASIGPQFALLVSTFVVIECLWYAVYALGGARLAIWLKPAYRQRMFNRATGVLFVAFGGLLLTRST